MLYVCRPNPSSKYLASCLACSIRSVCVIMVHQHVDRLRKLLRQSESKCADGEAKLVEYVAAGEAKLVEYVAAADAKLDEYKSACEAKLADSEAKRADAEAKLAEREAKLLEGERVIAGLQDNKVSLQETLKQSMLEINMGKLARQACEEEITLLRKRSGVILESLDSLEAEKLARKQHHYKAKNSVLRSFQWKEKEIDPVILEGAVAFWAATGEKDCTGTSTRTSKEMRKSILKAIIKDGFEGEL